MKCVQPDRTVILEFRIAREIPVQISHAGFAFVENWTAEKCVPFDVQNDFGKAFRLFEKLICLEASDSSHSVKRIRFRDRDDVVRHRIDAKSALKKILHHKGVA